MELLYLGPPDALDHVRASLSSRFDVSVATDRPTVDGLIDSCDVVLDASLLVPFPAAVIAKARNLKLFVTASTGADHVDRNALAERGIPFWTLKGQKVLENLTPTAEHTWLLMLACARRLRGAVQAVLVGEWDRAKYPGIVMRGKVLGIIGCGRLGMRMARFGEAFGMKCLGYDPYVETWPDHLEKSTLEHLLTQSDFITVHVTLSEETTRLLGEKEFLSMKPGVVLINTSRGQVIDEGALLDALLSGRAAAAGLDVLTGEPDIAGHRLIEYARTFDNLLITPHIGGATPETLQIVLSWQCQRIKTYFEPQS